jgi:putative FmdB family regulatory protein
MPIYEYYCQQCDREFELMRPMSQCDDPAFCPTCGGKGEKLISCCASKVDFYIRPPAKAPYRDRSKVNKRA